MKLSGVVEAVDSKLVNTKFGQKSTYSAKVGGTWLKFAFKNPGLNVGDNIEAEYNVSQYGNDVQSFVKTSGVSAPTTTAGTASAPAAARPAPTSRAGSFPIPALDGQRAIVRQNALTNARELAIASLGTTVVALTKKEVEKVADNIIELARKFESYSCGDGEMEAAKAAVEAVSATKQ